MKIRFVEYNGIQTISDWLIKSKDLRESAVLDALVHLLSELQVKKTDMHAAGAYANLRLVLNEANQIINEYTKSRIEGLIEAVNEAKEDDCIIALSNRKNEGYRKRKLNGGIRWVPDANLVKEASSTDDSSAADEAPSKKSKAIVATVPWYIPLSNFLISSFSVFTNSLVTRRRVTQRSSIHHSRIC